MNRKLKTFLQLNPYYVYGEAETPLQTQHKTEKYFELPLNLQLICIGTETADKIKEVSDKNSLSLEQAKKLSHLIRLVFFGELAIVDFIGRLAKDLEIDRELAKKIALDINKEIFHQVAPELREVQRKFQSPSIEKSAPPRLAGETGALSAPHRVPQTSQPAPPTTLPTLKEEYEERRDTYLEPIEENDRKPKPLIEGNVVNLKGDL